MCMEITTKKLLPLQLQSNRGIVNTFSGQKATPEQSKDMLTFHEIGMQAYEQYVTHRILQSPSLNAPVRRRRLLTMARRKMSKNRVFQKEKESRQVAKCLRRRLAWCNRTKLPYDTSHEQYSLFPVKLSMFSGS